MPDIDDLVLVVTGAASGIGAAAVSLWRDRGGIAIGLDMNTRDSDSWPCDVTSEQQVSDAIDQVMKEHGRVDAILHCAGVLGSSDPVTVMDVADWHRVMDVHVTAGFYLAKYGIPAMATSGGGALLSIGSIVASDGTSSYPAYAAAKAALIAFTKSLAPSAGRHRVRVNIISPGSVVGTNFLTQEQGTSLTLAQLAQLISNVPMGRATTALDVAEVAVFLASPAGRHITGTEFVVDGGERLPNRGHIDLMAGRDTR